MSIKAMKLALEALENASPAAWASRVDSDTMKSIWRKHAEALEGLQVLLAELDNASCKSVQKRLEAQQPATPEPAGYLYDFKYDDEIARDWFTQNIDEIQFRPATCLNIRPLYAHPAPSVPDGLQWFTVAEHGLPEVGEVVVGGLWYTDPWLKPECATSFMWGQCRVVDTKHRDFKDGKQWLTFGPSHNQITHWARLNPPAMLAANEGSK